MKVFIRVLINNAMTNLDITNYVENYMQTDERIDRVLNSGSFSFFSDKIAFNLPPFTKCWFDDENGNITDYWLCSSERSEVLSKDGWYYHNVSLISPTKITEAFLINSKAFSVIKNPTEDIIDYNKNWRRIEILTELVKENYGVSFLITDEVKELVAEREYQFGSGTTLFDAISEIMSTENRFPIVRGFDLTTQTYTLGAINYNEFKNANNREFANYELAKTAQNTDEYCSQIETEMPNVVDRDNLQSVVLSARTTESAINNDTASIITPSNIESVKSLGISGVSGPTGPTVRIPRSYYSGENIDVKRFAGSFYQQNPDTFLVDEESMLPADLLSKIKSWVASFGTGYEYNYQYVSPDYVYITFAKNPIYLAKEEGYIYVGVLEEAQYNLLEANLKPYHLYYKNGSNYIKGLYNVTNTDFWQSILFGERGPYLKELGATRSEFAGIDYVYVDRYVDYEEKASGLFGYSDVLVRNSFHQYFPLDKDNYKNYGFSEKPLDHTYIVNYYAQSPVKVTMKKAIQPHNEDEWQVSASSYNNGANSVDFNQLIPAMKRAVDMLGLPITTVITKEDMPIGTHTQFGYVIDKQTIFRMANDSTKITKEITYNCCDNYQHIAMAIGVASQFEATNLPQTGIIDRYIQIDGTLTQEQYDAFVNGDAFYFLNLSFTIAESGKMLSLYKQPQKLNVDDTLYMVLESSDNYAFDYKLGNSEEDEKYGKVYQNKPIAYADGNNQMDQYHLRLVKVDNLSLDDCNQLPYSDFLESNATITSDYYVANFGLHKIYKDPRERLIFSIKVNK